MKQTLNKILTISLGFISCIAWAGLSEFQKEKVVHVLKKNDACKVAVANVENGNVINPIFCVWDGILAKGTIYEKIGCYLGRYDVEDGTYSPVAPSGAGLKARSQPNGPCNKKIVQDILTKYPFSEYSSFENSTEPVLVRLKKESRSYQVIYDPENIMSSDVLARVTNWKAKPSKINLKKNLNCETPSSWQDEIQCMTPEVILAQSCNMNVSDENLKYRKIVYKLKTGKPMPSCHKNEGPMKDISEQWGG
jgi:hypothetical protein